jgi:hypothetical protein
MQWLGVGTAGSMAGAYATAGAAGAGAPGLGGAAGFGFGADVSSTALPAVASGSWSGGGAAASPPLSSISPSHPLPLPVPQTHRSLAEGDLAGAAALLQSCVYFAFPASHWPPSVLAGTAQVRVNSFLRTLPFRLARHAHTLPPFLASAGRRAAAQ